MDRTEQKPTVEGEELNLTELFPEGVSEHRYEFRYGPIEQMALANKVVLYKRGKNNIGLEHAVILGEKKSEVYGGEKNQLVRAEKLSSEEQKQAEAILRGQGVKGKIDFFG